jgi:hypothetical protein
VVVATGPTRRAEPALRVEQEYPGGDNPFTFLQARPDLDAIGELHAERDRPRLEPIAGGDEDMLLHSRIDDGVGGTVITSCPSVAKSAVP